MDIFKLLIGLAAITVLAAALGVVNLKDIGLAGLEDNLSPIISDIQAAKSYVEDELLSDVNNAIDGVKEK